MTIRTAARALAFSALLAAATLAHGQEPAPAQPSEPAITMEDARRIAKEHGVVRVEAIELDDGKWDIVGRDSTGAEIRIDLRASDGMVLKMQRERPASAGVRP